RRALPSPQLTPSVAPSAMRQLKPPWVGKPQAPARALADRSAADLQMPIRAQRSRAPVARAMHRAAPAAPPRLAAAAPPRAIQGPRTLPPARRAREVPARPVRAPIRAAWPPVDRQPVDRLPARQRAGRARQAPHRRAAMRAPPARAAMAAQAAAPA